MLFMRYVAKKTGILIVTLILISLLAFLAFQIIPGDPTTMLLGTEYTPERAAALREQMGLNRNVFVRYWDWLTGFIKGDMGVSYSYSIDVRELIVLLERNYGIRLGNPQEGKQVFQSIAVMADYVNANRTK